jgi:hypothetical protein
LRVPPIEKVASRSELLRCGSVMVRHREPEQLLDAGRPPRRRPLSQEADSGRHPAAAQLMPATPGGDTADPDPRFHKRGATSGIVVALGPQRESHRAQDGKRDGDAARFGEDGHRTVRLSRTLIWRNLLVMRESYTLPPRRVTPR